MRYRHSIIAAMMMVTLAGTASAQGLAARVGGGVAAAGVVGVTGLFGLELHATKLFARGEVRGIYTGQEAQMVYGGGGVGVQLMPRRAIRHYALITLGRGLDVREADYTTAAGFVFGAETLRALSFFGEVRVEHHWQAESPDFHVPPNQLTITAGLRLGGN